MNQNLERLRDALGDRYQIEKAVGQGGMATVYLATDLRHERRVAIKLMSPDLAATIGADRFSREVKIAAKLSHPNILGVFDSGEADGLLFYVMPFVEGESLRDKLIREKQLSIDEAIQITCEVCEALGYAHAQGIVHRDIKPENILLQGGHALVADFGIARLAEQTEKLTATGMAVGTAAYMSPEQAGGEKTDARGDVYALGCTLYEMLVGQPPFVGINAMAVMAQHSLATIPEIRVMRQSVPPELAAAIRRAMEKSPADRFQTMEEFKQAVLGDVPATATHARYTARYRVQGAVTREVRTRRWMMGAGVAAAAVVAGYFLTTALRGGSDVVPDANKVAVLYFADGSGGAMEHVADGLTESLIEQLETSPGVTVVPVNGVRPLRGTSLPSDSVRALFNIGTIVTGSVTRDGSKAKVQIDVVDAASDAPYLRKSVSVDTTQITTLRDTVAREVAESLREAIGGAITLKADREQTRSTAAWMLTQRAARLRRNADSLIGVKANDAALAALVSADSLLALAQREDARWPRLPALRGSYAWTRARLLPRRSPEQMAAIDSGLAHTSVALKLQSSDANALEARGRLQYARFLIDPERNPGMLDSAEATLVRSVQANRSQAGAWEALSNMYYSKPNINEANRAAKAAYESDAYLASANQILRRLFWTSHDIESYPEALQWCNEGRRRFPADPFFTECRLWMYTTRSGKPDLDSAWTYQAKYVALTDPKSRPWAERYGRIMVAGALARSPGYADSARHLLLAARATPDIDPSNELPAYEAVIRVMLGDEDTAVELLESYLAKNPSHLKGFAARVGPWWRDLQDNARFKRLIATAR
jgi:serine/threonine-protein kinase